jgi:hypothetical protein
LVQWGTITQGTYGATLKPKAQQFRVYPNEQLATDECLLNDDGEQEYDIGDTLADSDFSGRSKVIKLNNANPAPLDVGEPDQEVETVEVIGDETEPEPEPEPVVLPARTVTRPTRRVVAKKN